VRIPPALLVVLGSLPAIRATAAAPLISDPGAPLKKTAFTREWTIRAPGARPGDVVRLEIPDPVYAAYRSDFNPLHVEAQGREIQYTPDSRPEALPAIRLPEARPRSTAEAGVSRIDLPLLAPGLPLTAVRLRAHLLPFDRKVQVVDGATVLSERSWTCLPASPHPCELELAAGSPLSRSSRLSLRFLDGNNPPLPAVDVEIRRNRESLTFLWPRSGPVHLLTGAESTDVPDRGNEALDRAIDSRPTRRAWVEVPRTGSSASPAFAAAGVLLLALLGWRSRRRLRPALALAALAALPGTVRADAGRLYSRPVAVPSAGVVRVPLDLATLRHLGADGAGLRVFGPKGEEVPGWVQPYLSEDPERTFGSRITPQIRQEGPAVVLLAQLTQNPIPLHHGLFLEFDGPGGIEHLRARVEGSRDLETWSPVAEGDFFKSPPVSGRQKTLYLLTYPPNQNSFLRITIPGAEAAGFEQAYWGVVSTTPRVLSVPADRLDCESARRRTWCRLEVPARWQRPVRLALDLAGPEEMAIRVYAARQGGWSPLVQAIRRPARGSSRFVLPIVSGPLEGEALRIELQGVGGAPRVTGATLDLVQPVAVFHAASPGLYEIRYGDGRSYDGGTNDRPPSDDEESAWIAPGLESARELPPLPPNVSSPAVPLDGRFAAAWPLHAAGARPGDIVRLEIPAGVYAHSRSFGDDLRLSAGDRQIPYIRQTADDPAPVVARQGLRPKYPDIPLPQPGLPLTTWQVTYGPQAGDGANLQLYFPYKDASTYGNVYGKTDPLLPARIEGDLEFLRGKVGPRAREIRLEVSSPVDLALWRSRDILIFVWPREGSVVLRTGSDAGTPQYDLKLFAPDLLARPWHAAALGPKEPEIHFLRLLALLAGAGAALILLRKALPSA
jgi:LPXTG-motif cell wall-anchored protein